MDKREIDTLYSVPPALVDGLSTRSLFGSTSSPGFHGSSSFSSVTPPPVGTRTVDRTNSDDRAIAPPYPSPSPGASSQGSNKANWGNESKTSRVSTPSDLTNLSTILQNLEQFDIKLTPDQFDKLKKSVDSSAPPSSSTTPIFPTPGSYSGRPINDMTDGSSTSSSLLDNRPSSNGISDSYGTSTWGSFTGLITPPSSNPIKPTNQSEVSLNESSLGSFPSAYGDFSTPKFGSINPKSSWESGIGSELSRGVIGGQSGGHSRSNQERSMSFDHGLLKVQEFKPSLDLADSSLSGSRDLIPNPIGQSRPVSKWGIDIPKQSPSNVNWGKSLEQNRVQNGLSGLSATGSSNAVTGSSLRSSPAPSGQLTVDLGAIGEKSSKSSIFGLENIFNMGSKPSANSFIQPTHCDPVISLANHDPLFPSRDLYSRDVGLTPSKASSHPPIGHQSVANQQTDTWATPTHNNHHEIRRDSINHEPSLAGLPAEFKKRVESVFQSDFEGEIDCTANIDAAKKINAEYMAISRMYDPYNYDRSVGGEPEFIEERSSEVSMYQPIGPKTAASVLISKKSEEKLEEDIKTPNSNHVVSSKNGHPKKDDTLQGHEIIQQEQTQPIPDHLQHNYKFARICSECYVQNKIGFDGFHYRPSTGHKCGKTILIVKANDKETWSRVRSIPRHIDYRGPFLQCRHISQGEACPYGEACTFCYNKEEEEIWTWERRGLFNRNRLFVEIIKDPINHYLKQYNYYFYKLCKTCIDEQKYDHINCQQKPQCQQKQSLYHIEPGLRPVLIRDTPEEKTMELCRYSSTNRCNRGLECYFAHSMVELDAWKIYVSSGIDSDQIISKCLSELKKESSEEPNAEAFTYKHRWICSNCYKNGQQVQRKNKSQYCSARAAHSWRDPIMMCHIDKWSIVRDLLTVFSKSTVSLPQTFVVCKNIRDKNKCDYGDVCQFSHSDEECKVWNYMKENNIKSLKQLYKKLVK